MFESQLELAFSGGSRRTLLLIIAPIVCILMVLGLTGCQHRIALQHLSIAELPPAGQADDLAQFIPHFRLADQQSPWDSQGSANPDYVVSAADEVEFTWADGRAFPMAVSTVCLSTAARPNCGTCPFPSTATATDINRELIAGFHPRIPMAVLARTAGLIVAQLDPSNATVSNATVFDLCDSSSDTTHLKTVLDLDKSLTWSKVLIALTPIGPQPPSTSPIVAHLVPHPERRVLPGDVIRATLLWQNKTDDIAVVPFAAAQITSRIDAAGTGLLPGLSSPTNLLAGLNVPPPQKPQGLGREWVSDTDYSQFQVPLWQPAQDFGRQLTLEQVSACLSAIWHSTDNYLQQSVMSVIADCQKHGLDASYYASGSGDPSRNNISIRYHLEVDQSWTLITEDGRSFEQPFLPGTRIEAGVCSALRRIGELECDVRKARDEKTFAVVIPRGDLGPHDSYPFWTDLTRHRMTDIFNKILLAPGDTVRLSGRRPKQIVLK